MDTTQHHPPPGRTPQAAPTAQVVVPYTLDGLRTETRDAVMAWGGDYVFHRLPDTDPYAYAHALIEWWRTPADLVVIEHDIVPTPGMIAGLLACPEPWCGHPYHVGDGRYTYGLGLCKIGRSILDRYPGLAEIALRDHRGRPGQVHWRSVNEAIERQLTRYGHRLHRHSPAAAHLHYPEAGPDHG